MSEPDSTALKSIMIAAAIGVAIAAQTPAPPSPAELIVPPGFKASVFASDLAGARLMTVSPEGTLLVARRPRSEVVALRQDAGGNTPATPEVILSNLTNAHSLAFKDGWLYIATTPAVLRVRWANGRPQGEPEKVVDLPASTPSLHVSRTINFGPDGRLYVSIGSSCNVCVEPDPRRTTIQVLTGDGTLQPYARGLHNAIGFDWDPDTGRMWAGETGQDNLGDDFPPDEIDLIEAGKHYGFPFFIAKNQPNIGQPELSAAKRDIAVADAVPPALDLPAHISPIDLRFYRGTQFPPAFRHALFIAMHGSVRKTNGYVVARVVMKDGRPSGIENFASGFLKDGVILGRPAGLATGRDGALYVSDDNKGFIYRISYESH
ncbi:MAG: oxidoreductase [Acidobacteria bacterium]|nr:MAG: oxidoreductase [Acidobacteriota bacterium]